jgi:dephospho-CoA kinase
VYDCDTEAKRLMDNSAEIKCQLAEILGNEAIIDTGEIDRAYLSRRLFADKDLLEKVNSVVHPVVIAEVKKESEKYDVLFVETALLRESGMNMVVSAVWIVEAPEPIRVARVMQRSNMSAEAVRDRIRIQQNIFEAGDNVTTIENNDSTPVLPHVEALIERLKEN